MNPSQLCGSDEPASSEQQKAPTEAGAKFKMLLNVSKYA
jgi:hypothetical protein